MSRDPRLRDVLAVLVLYRERLDECPAFRSLDAGLAALGGTLELLVYDNSPAPGPAPAASSARWERHHVHDPSNPGVSRAYRTGARLARERGKRWLLLLDQDTWFPPDALPKYLESVERHPGIPLFAPVLRAAGRTISPCGYRLKRGVPLDRIGAGEQPLAGRSVLNSGLWIAVDDYLAVGGHDERLRLDFADHEFIERFKRRHDVFVVVDVVCEHGLSAAADPEPGARLRRFETYCEGARYASRGGLDGVLTAGVVALRACRLAVRHRSPGFLRVAAGSLLRRNRP